MRIRSRRGRLAASAAVILLAAPLLTAAAEPHDTSPAELADAVTLDGVLRHLDALQAIADAHGDRAAGRPGYRASVDYVAATLTAAGYQPSVREFQFEYVEEKSELHQVAPTPTTYAPGRDFTRNRFTPTHVGEATAPAYPVDVLIPPGPAPNSSTSGCEGSDFAGFPVGGIALLQRGTCGFAQKALNAQAAGASGAVLFNEGQAGRTSAITPSGDTPGLAIPVVSATYDIGAQLAAGVSKVVRVKVDFATETRAAWNVLAESRSGGPDHTVMAGAHLDSVPGGPGIDDNGSGSAVLLELAVRMAGVGTANRVRFAWWGAEEEGLLGSEHYVATLPQAERDRIALYLNFDMVGSPNHVNGVYDGDNSLGSAPPGSIPPGSDGIEDVFEAFYTARGLPFEDAEFSGRSDYGPFIAVGIPAGGLFTGAEGVKTPEQAARYGGVAGAAFDPCYHRPCDSLTPVEDGADPALYARLDAAYDLRGNVDKGALDVNADAVAAAVATFANRG
ncbi:MAG: M28 family peptidase [Saccharothrix sp.]|nr:M28 family peptidase [Saccharothrix sp.]